jgi:hypothetical protein
MRFSRLALGICLVLCSLAAFSQNDSKVQVFGGYSFLHLDSGGISNAVLDPSGTFTMKNNFSGWTGEFQYNVTDWGGIVADVSGNYGTRVSAPASSGFTGIPSGSSYTFMVGPVVQQSAGKLRPFAHVLFGFDRQDTDLASAAASLSTGLSTFPTPTNAKDTAFAMAMGGGVDWKAGRHISLRLGQIDYLYTAHDYSMESAELGAVSNFTHQNNFRFSTGVVFNLGR